MFVKYTYPISSDIFLPDAWPITWDRYRVTWTVNEGKAESITVSVQTSDLSGLPRIEERSQPGPVANIRIGHQPYQDEVESILRTACGLLGFFTDADIDFERPAIAWEPETPEGGGDRHGLNGLPTLRISMPARSFSYGGVSAVDDELRAEKAPYNGMVVRSYSIKSSDGSQVFASYRNYTFRQPDG